MTDKKPILTARELETLRHLAEGQSDLEIAERLGNSKGTVKNCLTTIRLKLAAFSTKPLSRRTNLAEFHKMHFANQSDSSEK